MRILTVLLGEILDEVVQVFSPTKIRQRARIYKPQERDAKAQHAFLELVQRVSVEPNIELVRYTLHLPMRSTMITDCSRSRFDVGTMLSDLFTDNGLHLMRSSYKPHRLIPGNYYPMGTGTLHCLPSVLTECSFTSGGEGFRWFGAYPHLETRTWSGAP